MRRFKSILIVDDDADVRESMSDVFSFEGYPNIAAADGIEALAALERCETPTLVLLDSVMPRMDGAAFLEALGRLESPKNIQVVFISAGRAPRPESPLVIGELPKPFDVDALLALLGPAPSFLVAERDPLLRQTLTDITADSFPEAAIFSAGDEAEAVATLPRLRPPCVAVLHWSLLSEAAPTLALFHNARVPVMLISGWDSAGISGAGPASVRLQKPFDLHVYVGQLRQLLATWSERSAG